MARFTVAAFSVKQPYRFQTDAVVQQMVPSASPAKTRRLDTHRPDLPAKAQDRNARHSESFSSLVINL